MELLSVPLSLIIKCLQLRHLSAFALVSGPRDRAGPAAAAKQAGAKRGSTALEAAAPAGAKTEASTQARKRRRSRLILPETEQQEEARPIKARTGATPGTARGARNHQRSGYPVGGERACRQLSAAAATSGRGEVIADSLEVDGCVVDAADDMLDDVSSSDTGHHDRADTQQHQPIQQQQQAGLVGKQGRADADAGQSAGAGQLLSGEIQWAGPSIEPPAQLGLTPSQHQTYYNAFTRVRLPTPACELDCM